MTTFVATGSTWAPNAALSAGTYFWRLHGVAAGVVGAATTAVWQFRVGTMSAPIDASWGSIPDVNGDGFADVLVGARGDGQTSGSVDVYFGGAGGVSSRANETLANPYVAGAEGRTVSVGDVNGDGFADVAVLAEGPRVAYVYLGGADGLVMTPSITIPSPSPMPMSGWNDSIGAAGDVDGDGYADVIVGWPCGACSGGAYVYRGGPGGLTTEPATTVAISFAAGTTEAWIEVAGAGDVNADGFGDVLIASGSIPETPGEVDLYLGSASGISIAPSGALAQSPTSASAFGYAIGSAGDVNGDGYCDVVVGASDGVNSPVSYGASVYLGGPDGLSPQPIVSLTAHTGSGGAFGAAVAGAGDVDADGYADVVVGTPDAYQTNGFVDIFFGGPEGPSATASTTFEVMNGSTSGFGSSVAVNGDVNADSFDDLIVGSPLIGEVDVYAGSTIGPLQTSSTQLIAPTGQTTEAFGECVE